MPRLPAQAGAMFLSLQPRVLLETGRDLRRHAHAVTEWYDVPVPDTGASSGPTRTGLGEVTSACVALTRDLLDLGDQTEAFLRLTEATDADVAAALSALADS